MTSTPGESDRPALTPLAALTSSFVTEQSVYGVILVSGMIVMSGAGDPTSLSVFVVVSTVIVFWGAHVYAGTVAGHGLGRDSRPLSDAFRRAVRQSNGLLVSALIPCAILLLGTARLVDDQLAIWAALLSGTALLAALGWIAFRRRGASVPRSLAGSAMTAAFGGIMALLKVVVVH